MWVACLPVQIFLGVDSIFPRKNLKLCCAYCRNGIEYRSCQNTRSHQNRYYGPYCLLHPVIPFCKNVS